MTTNELKKEAEEYALNQWEGNLPWSVIQKAYYDGALPREKRIAELEKACDETQELLDKQIEATYQLDKENAELKKELKEWKDEWQEQAQKATDEGYARTLQTIQLTKAKELLKGWLGDFYSPKAFYQQRAELVEQSEQFLKDSEVEK